MSQPLAGRAIPVVIPAAAAGLGLVALFALNGPYPAAIFLGVPVLLLVGLALGLRLPLWPFFAFLPLLLLGSPPAIIRVFDVVPLGLATLAFVQALLDPRREVWDIRAPGLLALAFLLVPMLALPEVVGLAKWLGVMKILTMACLLFFALRRVVPWERSVVLLAAFPMMGSLVAFQLLSRVSLIGGLLTARPQFRAFYTSVGWGSSNYLGAIFVLCIGGSVVLWLVHRSALIRALVGAAILLQLQALFAVQSRGASLALLIFVAFLVLGGGRMFGLVIATLSAVTLFVGLGTSAGQMLLQRFIDPREGASWLARMELWRFSWERFLRHPWTGIGLNQGQYVGDAAGDGAAHNLLLQALMEQGIAGGIVVVVFIVAVYRLAGRAQPWGSSVMTTTRVRRALTGLTTAVFVNSMVEPTLNGFEMLMLFAWFLGWLALQDPAGRASGAPSGHARPGAEATSG